MKHSIQWRLQLWHGAILALVLVAFAWMFYRAAQEQEIRGVDAELATQLNLVLESPDDRPPPPDRRGPPPGEDDPSAQRRPRAGRRADSRDPGAAVDSIRAEIGRNIWQLERRTGGRGDYYVFIDYDGTLLARSSNAPPGVPVPTPPAASRERRPLIPGQTARWDARSRGQYREVYRVLPLGDAVVVGRHLDGAALNRQLAWVAVAGIALLTAGLAGGWWFTRRALAPIGEISRTASEIASGDLSRRVEVAGSEDELGQLAGVLNHTFAQLQAAFQQQQRFTADASHELRTPVSVILSKTQATLARERSAADYQEALRVCQRAAQRMRTLTESLLALSRLDAGGPAISEPVDLAYVADECATLLQDRADGLGVTLRRELAPTQVTGDSSRLAQVATNLLQNAIQHTPTGGCVTIRTTVEGHTALLEVADTGCGIANEDLPHLFDRFYRADKARTGNQGAGLGLSIAQAAVAAHQGSITVDTQPGLGARFRVTLPALLN